MSKSKQLINNSISCSAPATTRHCLQDGTPNYLCARGRPSHISIHFYSFSLLFPPIRLHSASYTGVIRIVLMYFRLGMQATHAQPHTFSPSRVLFHLDNGIRNEIPMGNIKVPRISFIAHCVCNILLLPHGPHMHLWHIQQKSSLSFCQMKWKIASETNFGQLKKKKTNKCSGDVGTRYTCGLRICGMDERKDAPKLMVATAGLEYTFYEILISKWPRDQDHSPQESVRCRFVSTWIQLITHCSSPCHSISLSLCIDGNIVNVEFVARPHCGGP